MNSIIWILCSPLLSATLILLYTFFKTRSKRKKIESEENLNLRESCPQESLRVVTGSIASLGVLLSCVGIILLYFQILPGQSVTVVFWQWFETFGSETWRSIPVAFFADQLTIVMLSFIGVIAFLIHVYSVAYMSHESGSVRYFISLNLFLFFMYVLVLAENLAVLFVGWEGVGLCSYLLIGHGFQKREAGKSAAKAFIVNRIGDLGFLVAILILLNSIGTLDLQAIQESVKSSVSSGGGDSSQSLSILNAASSLSLSPEQSFWISIFLFLGACGKSAQFPLWNWLPTAMTGPTPVSALIHAATMVTAGVYLIVRLQNLFFHHLLMLHIILGIGLVTMLMGAIGALSRTSLKEILAYSTVSQLGLMFAALGLANSFSSLAHLYSHSFFKALLFLGGGLIIFRFGGDGKQDIFSLREKMKENTTGFPQHWFLLIGCLALAGIFPLNGYFSKTLILEAAREESMMLWFIFECLSILTIFYAARLYLVLFWKNTKWRIKGTLGKRSERWMTIPLSILSLFTVGTSLIFFLSPFFFGQQGTKLNLSPQAMTWDDWLSLLEGWGISIFAVIVAIIYFDKKIRLRPGAEMRSAFTPQSSISSSSSSPSPQTTSIQISWLDQVYQFILIRPLAWIAKHLLLQGLDRGIFWLINLPSRIIEKIGRRLVYFNERVYGGLANHLIAIVLITLLFFMGWALILEWVE